MFPVPIRSIGQFGLAIMDNDTLNKLITVTGFVCIGLCVSWFIYENIELRKLSRAGQQFLDEQRQKYVEYDIGRRVDE